MTVLEILLMPFRFVVYLLIYIYKWFISPLLPKCCRFYPTCSTYMVLAIKEWGVIRGSWLGLKRIFRCRPKIKGGEDFVPLNIKGGLKWVY